MNDLSLLFLHSWHLEYINTFVTPFNMQLSAIYSVLLLILSMLHVLFLLTVTRRWIIHTLKSLKLPFVGAIYSILLSISRPADLSMLHVLFLLMVSRRWSDANIKALETSSSLHTFMLSKNNFFSS